MDEGMEEAIKETKWIEENKVMQRKQMRSQINQSKEDGA